MHKERSKGTVIVTTAYILWGFSTLFWTLFGGIDSFYILAQRIIWSVIVIAPMILVLHRTEEVKSVFRSKKKLALCFLSGALVTVNWGGFIYAVSNDLVLDASLGYFIEPIVVSLIGLILFRERMSKWEKVTLFFAFAAVMYMILSVKTLPLLSLIVAFSFGSYGAVKKKIGLSAESSLFVESLCMSPFALLFVWYGETHGLGCSGVLQGFDLILLPLCGIVTSLPLLIFNIGVKKIPYYLSGILMYINPTIQFLIGLLLLGEALDVHKLIAFIVIWVGIMFTVAEKISIMKKEKLVG
ncbi:MAG: EamA family transporter RarD [Firmicutes bacterium]|nr:EamA family transporter RarD [Bacillota bacterium]MBQ6810735.1 EamA family transporter RarD [Bacillota bacterium]